MAKRRSKKAPKQTASQKANHNPADKAPPPAIELPHPLYYWVVTWDETDPFGMPEEHKRTLREFPGTFERYLHNNSLLLMGSQIAFETMMAQFNQGPFTCESNYNHHKRLHSTPLLWKDKMNPGEIES